MATLIATGILTAYLYSVAATFLIGGDVFYEAAAMLTTFSLLGHWMEMAARNATGEAIASLLKLAPATARVIRDGQESEVPVEEVRVGDVIAVRPGEKVPVDGVVDRGPQLRGRVHDHRRACARGENRGGQSDRRHPEHHRDLSASRPSTWAATRPWPASCRWCSRPRAARPRPSVWPIRRANIWSSWPWDPARWP